MNSRSYDGLVLKQ